MATPAPSDDPMELELTDIANGGDAVGRHQGRAIFVPGGLPDERVRVRLERERKNYARATLLDVLQPSPDRVAPPFPDLAESGGFQWQHIAYPAQLHWKTHIVRQLMQRFGQFIEPPVRPMIGMPEGSDPWRYRTVAQFAISPDGAIGFRRENSHDVLDMPTCPLVHPALDALYQQVRQWMRTRWGTDAARYTERFTLRVAANPPDASPNGERSGDNGLLAIEARGASAFADVSDIAAFAETMLAEIPGLAGVALLGLAGTRGRVVAGVDHLYEQVLGKTFRITAGSFFQVNPTQTPTLVREAQAAAQLSPTDALLDGYSGVGLFSLILADDAAHVSAIESQPSSVADARASATLNGVRNITITEGMLERVLGGMHPRRQRADVVLVDPPRAGCLPRALREIQRLAPRTFVYVSCDPATLARDLRAMCENGYWLASVQPVDMFPFTAHIECVACCQRIGSK
jgi:23S rRNA (uracil1939-C5)-methyltransferase